MIKTNSAWDSLTLFQELLEQWPDLLARSRCLRTADPDDPTTIKAAVIGFSLYYPIQGWSKANFEYIDSHLNSIAPLDTFGSEPACNEAHRVFGCLGLGALLGKYNVGEIDDAQATKGEWGLMAFLSRNSKTICESYKFAEENWQGS